MLVPPVWANLHFSALVDPLDLVAIPCLAPVTRLVQSSFSVSWSTLLSSFARSMRPRGVFQCDSDAVKFVAEIAVQFIPYCFFVLGKDTRRSWMFGMARGKLLNNSRFLSSHRLADILTAVPSPQIAKSSSLSGVLANSQQITPVLFFFFSCFLITLSWSSAPDDG